MCFIHNAEHLPLFTNTFVQSHVFLKTKVCNYITKIIFTDSGTFRLGQMKISYITCFWFTASYGKINKLHLKVYIILILCIFLCLFIKKINLPLVQVHFKPCTSYNTLGPK